jgi:hypothetical protein
MLEQKIFHKIFICSGGVSLIFALSRSGGVDAPRNWQPGITTLHTFRVTTYD